jgi:hypothetical protein
MGMSDALVICDAGPIVDFTQRASDAGGQRLDRANVVELLEVG